MDSIKLCCTQDRPVVGEQNLTAMWKNSAGVPQWFASDRYNYLYVRTSPCIRSRLPWDGPRIELHLAFRSFAGEEHRSCWRELLSNNGNNFVKLEQGIGLEPFLIPPVFFGEYAVIAELKTPAGRQPLQKINIECRRTHPCVWEGAYDLAEGQTIRLDGGTWSTGSWRFLSGLSGQQGTMTRGEDIPLRLDSGERGILRPSIFVENLRLLSGLSVETKSKEGT